ncbi:MAG: PD40 domain-containing protein, partial [Acidobacteria bacterium]|nr:PD40 domain-containing protein [Acidobacteriota bacterium]
MNWKQTALLVCVLVLAAAAIASTPETRLMRYPDISRDQVVFVYAGDLWVAPRAGNALARRLTAHPGDELFPKFSPDGQRIAFTGEYDGNSDVYVIPAEGGEPRRLTFHPSSDLVLGWTPDSKKVLFRSDRYSSSARYHRLFLVPVEGGFPEVLPVPRGGLTSFSPDGQRIAYNPWGREFRTWKRYRGGWATRIAVYDLKRNTYEELPRVNANDMFPMWHRDAIYFASDRDGVMNLYRYDLGNKRVRKLTDYKEYDVKWPSLGPDAIVFENGGQLYSYDLTNGRTSPIPVRVASDLVVARPEIKGVADRIRTYALSPTAARALFEARGDIFTVPIKHGSTRNLTDTPDVHERGPAWSPDGDWVAYLSDRTGEYELYVRPQKGGEEIRITSDGSVYRWGPIWSPDNQKLLYWDKKLRLWYVDKEEKKPVLIDQSEYGGFTGADWSPDSRWVTYSKADTNFFRSVFLYSLEQKKVFPITNSFYNDFDPVFDQNGKYLYFISERFFFPSSGEFDNRFNYHHTAGIFAVTLKADEPSPFAPQSDEEKAEEEKKDEKEKKEGAAAEKKEPVAPAVEETKTEGQKAEEKKSEERKAEEEKKEVKP